MLEQMQNLRSGKLDKVKNGSLFPLVRWLSGHQRNLPMCAECNRLLLSCKPRWLIHYLSLHLTKGNQRIKFPRATKFDNKKYDIMVQYLKQKYGWSKDEIEYNKKNIVQQLENNEWITEIANCAGWSDKERRVFGLKVDKDEKPEIRTNRSIFSF